MALWQLMRLDARCTILQVLLVLLLYKGVFNEMKVLPVYNPNYSLLFLFPSWLVPEKFGVWFDT